MLRRGLLALIIQFEDNIIQSILRRPGFHHFVGRIQRFVDEKQNGPRPEEPLKPGEATELPSTPGDEGFLRHFIKELKSQITGDDKKGDDGPGKGTR